MTHKTEIKIYIPSTNEEVILPKRRFYLIDNW